MQWDPNHIDVFANERSATWLKEMWETYTKPKYKKSLSAWNKETGGGDGTAPSFINYCGRDRWIVWLFCLDKEANFLLGSSAGGRMPKHLQIESGFKEVSSLGNSNKRASLEDKIEMHQNERKALASMIEKVESHLTSKEDAPTQDIHSAQKLSSVIEDPPDSLSPDSKALFCEEVSIQRKQVLERMKERKRRHNGGDNQGTSVNLDTHCLALCASHHVPLVVLAHELTA